MTHNESCPTCGRAYPRPRAPLSEAARTQRVADKLRTRVFANAGPIAAGPLRAYITQQDRDVFERALDALVAVGDVQVVPTQYHGQVGRLVSATARNRGQGCEGLSAENPSTPKTANRDLHFRR